MRRAKTSTTTVLSALEQLSTLFPEADRAFLAHCIEYHISKNDKQSLSSEHLVGIIAQKLVEDMGQVYPGIGHYQQKVTAVWREDSEMKGKGKDTSEDGWEDRDNLALNDALTILAQIYPFHPLQYLRYTLIQTSNSTSSSLSTTSLTLWQSANALVSSRASTFSKTGSLSPLSLLHSPTPSPVPPREQFRSTAYKTGLKAYIRVQFPELGASPLEALLAENNWDYVTTVAAVERYLEGRGFISKFFGKVRRGFLPSSAPSSSSVNSNSSSASSARKKDRTLELWEKSASLMRDIRDSGAQSRKVKEAADEAAARDLNHKLAEEEGALLECGCCTSDETFESMGRCSSGHLICVSCINRHVNILVPTLSFSNSTIGLGAGTLIPCPSMDSCPSSIPLPTLKQCLEPKVWRNYQLQISRALARQVGEVDPESLELIGCPWCSYFEISSGPSSLLAFKFNRFSVSALISTLPMLSIFSSFLLAVSLYPNLFLLRATTVTNSASLASSPWPSVKIISARLDTLIANARYLNGSSLFRCRNTPPTVTDNMEPDEDTADIAPDDHCGRTSCLMCKQEVFGLHDCRDSTGRSATSSSGGGTSDGKASKEEREQDEMRLFIEGAMTEAVKRTCPKCMLGFTKSDACNKMTCPRDGYKMCYICRSDLSGEGYSHFCPHFRLVPGPCTQCTKCDLYMVPDSDEAVKLAAEKAKADWIKNHPLSSTATSAKAKPSMWINGGRAGVVGPLSESEIAQEALRMTLESHATQLIALMLRLLGNATSVLHLLFERPRDLGILVLISSASLPILLVTSVLLVLCYPLAFINTFS